LVKAFRSWVKNQIGSWSFKKLTLQS
jgi:hypothetical protein